MAVRIQIKAVPGASKTEVSGWLGDALKIRVVSPPVSGKANTELLGVLAKLLGLPSRSLHILSGASNPRKAIEIQDLSEEEVLARLNQHILPRTTASKIK